MILECRIHKRQWVAIRQGELCPWCQRDGARSRLQELIEWPDGLPVLTEDELKNLEFDEAATREGPTQ